MVKSDEEFEMILKGRRVKAIRNRLFRDKREAYDMKQVEIEVLLYLFSRSGVSAKKIAEDLQLQKGHVTLAKERLLEKGYIRCVKDADDRRFDKLMMTEAGKQVCDDVLAVKDEFNRKLFRGFTDEECETLKRLLEKMMRNIIG